MSMQPRITHPASLHPLSTDAIFASALEFGHRTQHAVEELQGELNALKAEINMLRRRDETLKFYMTRVDEELRLAARLQQDFLPKILPHVGPVRFHTLFRPAGYVSGDLYDVMRLDETHVGFFLCDAVGHGMPAALLTMFIKRALISKEIFAGGYRLLSPAETMGRLNDALVEQNLSQATFATACYGVIDTTTLECTIASGGHPQPLLLRGATLTPLNAQGPLLGIFEAEVYSQFKTQLSPGDKLVIYSDGIEVTFAEDIATQSSCWRDELIARHALSGEALLIDYAEAVDHEVGSLTPKDDLTVLIMEIESTG